VVTGWSCVALLGTGLNSTRDDQKSGAQGVTTIGAGREPSLLLETQPKRAVDHLGFLALCVRCERSAVQFRARSGSCDDSKSPDPPLDSAAATGWKHSTPNMCLVWRSCNTNSLANRGLSQSFLMPGFQENTTRILRVVPYNCQASCPSRPGGDRSVGHPFASCSRRSVRPTVRRHGSSPQSELRRRSPPDGLASK
jgi:hypothetical protein